MSDSDYTNIEVIVWARVDTLKIFLSSKDNV